MSPPFRGNGTDLPSLHPDLLALVLARVDASDVVRVGAASKRLRDTVRLLPPVQRPGDPVPLAGALRQVVTNGRIASAAKLSTYVLGGAGLHILRTRETLLLPADTSGGVIEWTVSYLHRAKMRLEANLVGDAYAAASREGLPVYMHACVDIPAGAEGLLPPRKCFVRSAGVLADRAPVPVYRAAYAQMTRLVMNALSAYNAAPV